jgi:hypothetical protein
MWLMAPLLDGEELSVRKTIKIILPPAHPFFFLLLFSYNRGFSMLFSLASNLWSQMILLPQLPE